MECEHEFGDTKWVKSNKFPKGHGELSIYECVECKSVKVPDLQTIFTPKGFVKFQTTFELIKDEDKDMEYERKIRRIYERRESY